MGERFSQKDVSESNTSYLVQYSKVRKHNDGSSVFVDMDDLKNYYDSYHDQREVGWKKKLGNDLNWALSFDHLREKDITKYVHRLHPYKGKFIPQLVQYFIDNHTDDFKKNFFKKTFSELTASRPRQPVCVRRIGRGFSEQVRGEYAAFQTIANSLLV